MKRTLLWFFCFTLTTSLFSQRAFIHYSNEFNTELNYTFIDNALLNGNPNLLLHITKTYNPNGQVTGLLNEAETGLWYSGKWSIYNETKAAMNHGESHNVFIPAIDDNSYIHIAADTTISTNTTFLSHPMLDGDPDALVFITHNWEVSGIYNTSPTGVWYSLSKGKWGVFNQDLSVTQENIAYNVYIPKENDIAFVHAATAENISGSYSYIDTSIINNNPNAVLIVTQNYNPNGGSGKYNKNTIGIWYDFNEGQWVIFNENLSPMPVGADFNILVADLSDAATLPAEWETMDIGSPYLNGMVNYGEGNFLVEASGVDIWNTHDAFRYVYQELAEDEEVEIIAKVASLEKANEWTKAGVMIRQSLDSNSINSFVSLAADWGVNLTHRNSADASTAILNGPDSVDLTWVRLVKDENTITAYTSQDGNSWDEVGSNTVSLEGTYYAGLAVTSTKDSELATAIFDSVELNITQIPDEPNAFSSQPEEDQVVLNVSPNPAVNFVQVEFQTTGTESVKLSVFSIDGRLLTNLTHELYTQGLQRIGLDVSAYREGMYLVVLESNGNISTQKLFKVVE